MAFANTTTWEVAATGSDGNAGADTNAGGFNPASTNMVADLTTTSNTGNTATPEVSSASYNFIARDVGHWLFIRTGTNWLPGWYKITSVASNKATLAAAIGEGVLYSTGGAYSVSTADGVASVGTPTSGTWTIDYSQCGTGLAFTDLVQASTTTCTSAAMPMGKNFVANTFRIASGGTGVWTVQTLLITGVTGTTATVDKTLGGTGGTGGTGVMGGCLASPGMASGLHIGSNKIWIKNGTYTITSASTNVSGGCLTVKATSSNTEVTQCIGYNALRTDAPTGATRPLLQASGISTFSIVTGGDSSSGAYIANLIVDGAGLTSSAGFTAAFLSRFYRCTAKNCKNHGFNVSLSGVTMTWCDATGCATNPAFRAGHGLCCVAWSNTSTGFGSALDSSWTRCLSVNNSGASSDGFSQGTGVSIRLVECTAYGNGRDGMRFNAFSTGVEARAEACLSYANTGTNFNASGAYGQARLEKCAAGIGGVSSANVANLNLNMQAGNITLTADPFTAKGSGDFSLNNTAGGGELCRASGVGAFPGISTTTYPDAGAAQHQDAGGGGGSVAFSPFNSPVIRGVA